MPEAVGLGHVVQRDLRGRKGVERLEAPHSWAGSDLSKEVHDQGKLG